MVAEPLTTMAPLATKSRPLPALPTARLPVVFHPEPKSDTNISAIGGLAGFCGGTWPMTVCTLRKMPEMRSRRPSFSTVIDGSLGDVAAMARATPGALSSFTRPWLTTSRSMLRSAARLTA